MRHKPMPTPSADPYSSYNTYKNKKKKQTSGYVTNTVTPPPQPAHSTSPAPSATKNYEQPVPQLPKVTTTATGSKSTVYGQSVPKTNYGPNRETAQYMSTATYQPKQNKSSSVYQQKNRYYETNSYVYAKCPTDYVEHNKHPCEGYKFIDNKTGQRRISLSCFVAYI